MFVEPVKQHVSFSIYTYILGGDHTGLNPKTSRPPKNRPKRITNMYFRLKTGIKKIQVWFWGVQRSMFSAFLGGQTFRKSSPERAQTFLKSSQEGVQENRKIKKKFKKTARV